MASLVDTLTASGGPESAGFLNDIIAQLWPNINVAGCRMVKEIVEPMLASMLPGPLAGLHFVKLDLGPVPLRVSRVDVHRTAEQGGIKLDMDVDWQGKCDFDLEGKMVPRLGVERVRLRGRLSVLLAPLTNIIPLIGAAQVAFINPPELKLDFTGAADIADCSLIEKSVRKIIIGIISSMAVLPNRYLVKLDGSCDFFKAYLPHIGVLRLTVDRATNIVVPKNSGGAGSKLSGLLSKVGIRDVPDCYAQVTVGAEAAFRTSTVKDSCNPEWNETHDFLVADMDQEIVIDVDDEDPGSDDDVGIATISIRKLLLGGGAQELPLVHKGEPVQDASVTVRAQFFNLVGDAGALPAGEEAQAGEEGQVVGLATVLIASVLNLQGQRDELQPSVRVTYGNADRGNTFNTATKTYSPGTDIFNPVFDQAFCIPITRRLLVNPPGFEMAVMNGKEETVGTVELPFEEVLNAEGCVKEGGFDVGGGVQIRAQISIRTLSSA